MLPAQAAALEIRKRLLGPQAAMNAQRRVADIVPLDADAAAYAADAATIEALTKRIEVLEKLLGMRHDGRITRRIQETVALHYGLTLEELLTPCRMEHIIVPRQVAIYLASKITRRSFSAIAAAFGGFDHSTILKAIRSIDRRRAKNPTLDEELNTFLAAFRGQS